MEENHREITLSMAKELQMYATHFAHRDWNYTRDIGNLISIRYDDGYDSLWQRLKFATRWLFRNEQSWEKVFNVSPIRMFFHSLKRDRHIPDGVLDNGKIITFWEEDGEYLQYVQPQVGEVLGKWMEAEPDSPFAQEIALMQKRFQDDYAERAKEAGWNQ